MWHISLLLQILFYQETYGGFQPLSSDAHIAIFGAPCACSGGTSASHSTPSRYTQVIDCNTKTAYLVSKPTATGGMSMPKWFCVPKPPVISTINGRPGTCPCSVFYQTMHSTCYDRVQQCSSGSKTYFTAILQKNRNSASTGDWSESSAIAGLKSNKYLQAGCQGTIGQSVCWEQTAPIYMSDGGGPQDTVRELTVQNQIEHLLENQFPKLTHHPLALPKSRGVDLDTQTTDILTATHQALNISNPKLAQDCWLCLNQGTPMPLAIPADISTLDYTIQNCTLSLPFRAQPMLFHSSPCIYKDPQNNTFDIPVGIASFINCSSTLNSTTSLCPGSGRAFICGNNLAFTALPTNWTGLCALATLLPDIDIIPGDEPVPVPALDHFAGRHKRALAIIPLLVGLGVSGAVATGTAGLGVAVHSYAKLSKQLIDDVQTLSSTISDIQDQLDSLAEVVLQNRRGLDLLTAEQGGICLALQERCCFYANKSGIVRDKIKNLQEDLEARRRALSENPFFSGLNGLLPFLLPFLGPLVTIILFLTFAPWILKRVTNLIKDQLNTLLGKPIQIHYHQLEMNESNLDTQYSFSERPCL